MTTFLQRYLSFDGRLTRLPYFIRNLQLGIIVTVLMVPAILLFASGNRALWWAGIAVTCAMAGLYAAGSISLTIRRLHDLGLSGWHATWVAAAGLAATALSYAPANDAALALPMVGVSLWLLLYPGNAGADRYGTA